MSTVELMGLVRAQKKAKRAQLEMSHHQECELAPQDKHGKCYTYRGVEYCYV